MKIEKSEVTKLKISKSEKLDPVTVFLEDLGRRQGQITIKCFDEVWSSYWGAMGDRTIAEFFCSCDHHYLAKNLSRIKSTIPDYKAFKTLARKTIGKRLAHREIEKEKAVELLHDLKNCEIEYQTNENYSLLCDIFGSGDWMFDVPEKLNHEYEYLCRVIDTVKEALKRN